MRVPIRVTIVTIRLPIRVPLRDFDFCSVGSQTDGGITDGQIPVEPGCISSAVECERFESAGLLQDVVACEPFLVSHRLRRLQRLLSGRVALPLSVKCGAFVLLRSCLC